MSNKQTNEQIRPKQPPKQTVPAPEGSVTTAEFDLAPVAGLEQLPGNSTNVAMRQRNVLTMQRRMGNAQVQRMLARQKARQNGTVAPSVQRQEVATEAVVDDKPTPEQKAAALAKAAAAEAAARNTSVESKSNTAKTKGDGQAKKAAGETPKSIVAASKNVTKAAPPKQTLPIEPQARSKKSATEKGSGNGNGAGAGGGGGLAIALNAGGGGGAIDMATSNALASVDAAIASADVAADKAPTSSEEDQAYVAVDTNAQKAADLEKEHDPAAQESADAQAAAESPEAELMSQAQNAQVIEVENTPTPGFDGSAFKAKLMERVAALAPQSMKEADDFKESGKVDTLKGSIDGEVETEKDSASGSIDEKNQAAPDLGNAKAKPVTPLVANEAGDPAAEIGAQGAVPKKKGVGEVEQPIADSAASLDQQMADAEITEEQLLNSNEPDFIGAVDEKNTAKEKATAAPGEFRTTEATDITTAEAEAQDAALTALTDIHGARTTALTEVDSEQDETKSEDEKKREEVGTHIDGIYQRTKTKVDEKLNKLDTDVSSAFDAGAAQAAEAFEDYVDRKMEAYKEERYGGMFGWAKWGKDKLLGMPSEVNVFYTEGRQLYIDKMDAVIDNIVAIIGTTLAEAKAEVAKGKVEIKEYVDQLPEDLKEVGEQAANDIQARFDELEQSIDDKQGELIDTLAQKYNENLQAIDTRIEELKEANKGLVQKAIEAVGDVIQTIMELKQLLSEVLARAAAAIAQIIKDPIGFLGNLVAAVKQGFQQFVDNIGTHMQKGLIGWLTGTLMENGVELPESFDLPGIFQLVMQVLGLSFESIVGKVSDVLGIDIMGIIDPAMQLIELYQNEGVEGLARAGLTQFIGEDGVAALMEVINLVQVVMSGDWGQLWTLISGHLASLKEMVMGKIEEFIATEVIKQGVMWVISLFNPAGAFIKACKMIYDVVMFFVERGSQIMNLVNAVIDSVAAIATGGVGGAAAAIEQALASSIPVAIGFMSSLLGLGNISGKVQEIIQSARGMIDGALNAIMNSGPVQMVSGFIKSIIGKIKNLANRGLNAIGLGDETESEDAVNQTGVVDGEQTDGASGLRIGEIGQRQTFSDGDEQHSMWVDVSGAAATLMVASTPMTVEQRLNRWEAELADLPETKRGEAQRLIGQARSLLDGAEESADFLAAKKANEATDSADSGKVQEEQSELVTEQRSLAPILGDLFRLLDVPELVGNGKTKYDQIMSDSHIPDGIKTRFTTDMFDKLAADNVADGNAQWGVMKGLVASDSSYLATGPDVPLNALQAKGGMTRLVPLQTIWNDNLSADYKDKYGPSYEEWLAAVSADPSIFKPEEHINGGSTIPAKYATSWWAVRSEQKGNTIAELVDELDLNPSTYIGGGVRVTIEAQAAQMAGFKKPTAFDGIFFMEFAPAASSVWGVTASGSLEAVAPKVPMSNVTKREFLPANMPPPGDARSQEEKQQAIDDAVQEIDALLASSDLTIEDIEAQLPTIKEKYQLATIELVQDGESEYHVDATINPRGSSGKQKLFSRNQVRDLQQLAARVSRHIKQKGWLADYRADPRGFLLNPGKVQSGDVVEAGGLQDVIKHAEGLTVLRNVHLKFVTDAGEELRGQQAEMDFLILGASSVAEIISAKLNPASFRPGTDRAALAHYANFPLNNLGAMPRYMYSNFGTAKAYPNVINANVHFQDEDGAAGSLSLEAFRGSYLNQTVVDTIEVKSLTPGAENEGDPMGDITTVATATELVDKLAEEVNKLL